jgi:hypothetical protein
MKKYIIILLTFWAAFSFAQETDAIFKKIKKEHIFHSDGSIEYKYYKELKLLTPYAFNRLFGETFIIYNPDFQKLKIHQAYTIMKNGRKVEAPENAFNEVLPRAAANYPTYNQMKEMVVTHTGLDVGCTIYLEYSIISNPPFIKEMMGTEILEESVPVENYEVVLTVPARRGLRFEMLNSAVKPEESNDGKYRSYNWRFSNLSQKSYEQSSPANYRTAPVISFSTFMDDASAIKAIANQEAYLEKGLPISLTDAVKKILADTNDQMAQALAIQKMIVNDINTKFIPFDLHNYKLQTPRRVWDANVGSVLEKTILLAKALEFAKMKTQIVGFYPLSLLGQAPLIPSYFEDFGVMIMPTEKGTEAYILSAHSLNQNSLEFAHPTAMVMDIQTGEELFFKSIKNHINVMANLTLDLGYQIFGDVNMKLTGGFLNEFNLKSDASKVTNELFPPVPIKKETELSAKMNDHSISVSYQTYTDGKAMHQENYYFWKLPQVKSGIAAQHFNILPTERDFPIVMNAIEESYEYVITLPKSVEWVGNEYHQSYSETFGKMSLDVFLKDGKLVVKKNLTILPEKIQVKAPKSTMNVDSKEVEIQQRTLSVEEYAVFRQMMIDWNSDLVNMLVFKR